MLEQHLDPPYVNLGPKTFSGSDYVESRDRKRLTTQIGRLVDVMQDRRWRSVAQICAELSFKFPLEMFPENSIQAQLRNLRKIGYDVPKRNVADKGTLYEYAVLQGPQ